MEDCSFCSQFTIEKGGYFRKITYDNFVDRIIWEDDNFVIVPTVGAFIEGYILLLPKKHICSYANIKSNQLKRLEEIIHKINQILREVYNKDVVSFEHGSISNCRLGGGACYDHAHMHFLPANLSYKKHVEKKYVLKKIHNISHLKSFEKRRVPYFYFSENNDDMFVCDAISAVSQYFRQISVVELNLGNVWRWQTFHFLDKMMETYKKLKPYFLQL